jgi:HTH-type transcriptional regulator/antitoxin MqsA
MKCFACSNGELIRDCRDLYYTYKNETATIKNVEGDFCSECNEGYFKNDISEKIFVNIQQFKTLVDAELVSE